MLFLETWTWSEDQNNAITDNMHTLSNRSLKLVELFACELQFIFIDCICVVCERLLCDLLLNMIILIFMFFRICAFHMKFPSEYVFICRYCAMLYGT